MPPTKHLDIPPAAARDHASFEVLRVWIAEQGQHVSIRSGAWEDPFAWGIVLADLARHIAFALSPAPDLARALRFDLSLHALHRRLGGRVRLYAAPVARRRVRLGAPALGAY